MTAISCPLCSTSTLERAWRKGDYQYWRCAGCENYWVLPRPSEAVLSAFYNQTYFAGYEDFQEEREADYRLHFGRVRGRLPPGRILEVGCGTGKLLEIFALAGWEAFGIEPSRYAASFARDKRRLNVFAGFLEDYDGPAKSFDVIVIWDVLSNALDPFALVDRSLRLLGENGILLIRTPMRSAFDFRLESALSRATAASGFVVHYPFQINHFTKQGFFRFLEKCGLTANWHYFGRRLKYRFRGSLPPLARLKAGISGLMLALSDGAKSGSDSIVCLARRR